MTATRATRWVERARGGDGPIYSAIVRALEQAIREGELQAGDRLPPQRAVAQQLGVDLTTVTRAYSTARALGLLEGTVGRGTFVRARTQEDEAGLVDLSMNLPPPPEGLSLANLLRETTSGILQRTDPAVLMAYHPGFGTLGQRAVGAQWLAPCLGEVAAERVLVSPGAQAALAAVLSMLCRPGDGVVADALTYPGFIGVARQLGLRIVACPSDAEGPVPEALAEICARERPVAAYLIPTMQNPRAVTAGAGRRAALAQVLTAAGTWLVEDDPYSRLMAQAPRAITSLMPERGIYIGTLAKTLSPGLRIAYVACPSPAGAERVATTLRALALMPPPLMAAVATSWIRDGVAEKLLGAVRAEARARRALAAQALPQATGADESLHVWLPLAAGVSADEVRMTAQQRGLALVTSEAFATGPGAAAGVRISLGGPGRRAVLKTALASVAAIVGGERTTRTVV